MARYSTELKDQIFEKGHGFLLKLEAEILLKIK